MGQLRLRDAVTIIPEADAHVVAFFPKAHIDAPPVAAVLGGVIQQVAEDLLEALRVSRDEGDLRGGAGVIDLHASLLHKLAVGEEGVLQFGGDIYKLDAQIEAPVLYPCKLQKLRHHAGEALGLLGDDVDAPERISLDRRVKGYGLTPAHNCGKGSAQLVGDLGNEVGAGLLRNGNLFRHVVYLLGQLAYLIITVYIQLHSVAAFGYVL